MESRHGRQLQAGRGRAAGVAAARQGQLETRAASSRRAEELGCQLPARATVGGRQRASRCRRRCEGLSAQASPQEPASKEEQVSANNEFCFCSRYKTDSCSAAACQSRTSALLGTWDVLAISQPCIRLDVLNAPPESSQDCCDVCAGLSRMSHQLLPLTRKRTPQDGRPGEHANGDPPGSFTNICTLGNFSDQNHQNNSGPHERRCALHCHSASSNEPLWPCRSKKRAEQRKRARERSAGASAGGGEDLQPPAKRPVRSLATQCSHYKPLSH